MLDEEKDKSIRRLKKVWLEQIKDKIERELGDGWSNIEETVGQGLGIDRKREKDILELVQEAILENSKKHEIIIFLQKKELREKELLLAVFYASLLMADYMLFLQNLTFLRKRNHFTEILSLLERTAIEKISEEIFSSIGRPDDVLFGS